METPTKLSWYSSALLKLQLIPFCFSVVAVQVQGAERGLVGCLIVQDMHDTRLLIQPNSNRLVLPIITPRPR
jgi:hypothetical protein